MVLFYRVLTKADNHDVYLSPQERYRAGERVTITARLCTHLPRAMPA